MNNGAAGDTGKLNAHLALTRAELEDWPVHELQEDEWHDSLHILCTVMSNSRVLTYSVINFMNKRNRNEKQNKHDSVEEDSAIHVYLEQAEVFTTELLSHESGGAKGEANSDRKTSDANSEGAEA